jgi:outer membrane lipoprotein-sorting protein
MKLLLSIVSAFALYASAAKAETATQVTPDKLSCEAISGQYTDGYCLVSVDDIQVPADAKWVTDKDGTSYTLLSVNGKNVVVYDGFLLRISGWEILYEFFQSSEIGCSGRYTC